MTVTLVARLKSGDPDHSYADYVFDFDTRVSGDSVYGFVRALALRSSIGQVTALYNAQFCSHFVVRVRRLTEALAIQLAGVEYREPSQAPDDLKITCIDEKFAILQPNCVITAGALADMADEVGRRVNSGRRTAQLFHNALGIAAAPGHLSEQEYLAHLADIFEPAYAAHDVVDITGSVTAVPGTTQVRPYLAIPTADNFDLEAAMPRLGEIGITEPTPRYGLLVVWLDNEPKDLL